MIPRTTDGCVKSTNTTIQRILLRELNKAIGGNVSDGPLSGEDAIVIQITGDDPRRTRVVAIDLRRKVVMVSVNFPDLTGYFLIIPPRGACLDWTLGLKSLSVRKGDDIQLDVVWRNLIGS